MMKITDEEFDLGVEMERQCAAEQLPGAAKAWATEQDSAKAEGREPNLAVKFSLGWVLSKLESPTQRDAGIRLLTSLEDSNYEHLDDVSYALAMAHTCSGDLEAAQAHVCRLLRICPGHSKGADLHGRIRRKMEEKREQRQA
mmetsp:Transcript_5092/g.11219  ORF Transcript_5092/g.11219 Transcript_5092/m.11219 type:complete len:142 (-) Transcript_5092:259-684(-)